MYLVRLISSEEHPTMSAVSLLNLIAKIGIDRYDPARKSIFTEHYDGHVIDFFATAVDHRPTIKELKVLQHEFLAKSAGDREPAIKPDIAIIYDASKCEMVQNVYPGVVESDCYRFISDPKEALVDVVFIDGPPKNRAQRLDQYVVQERPLLSRAFAAKLIGEGKVLVSGKQQKAGYKIRPKDDIAIDFEDSELDVIPSIDLPIIYEDDNMLVINKPSGIISHARGRYWDEASVASFLREHINEQGLSGFDDEGLKPGQPQRAGIVHRLDRATSGVMICAKNAETLSYLQKQFSDRNVQKTYLAVIQGVPKTPEALIDMPIERNPKLPSQFRVGPNGKPSQTQYKVLQSNDTYSLLELKPLTGRTHQLRVHLKQIGHPIVGDQMYEGEPAERLLLHAHKLEITLPDGTPKTFEAPVPSVFNSIVA